MPLYTSTGALNVALSDTTGTGRYSASGALRINLVSGTAYVGLYAADGSMNVVDVTGVSISTYGGLYHPSGAIRGRTAPTTLSGLQAPDGSYYFLGLFSPLNLFSAGEQGAWYDPSDYSTMFQDSAGTTPVTAVEQPVGLILDKSKGLALGPELVTNGTFDTGITGWTKGAGTTAPLSWDSTGKRLLVTNDLAYFASGTQTISGLTVGKSYLVTAAISDSTVDARIQINGLAGATSATFPPGGGAARFVFTATATSHVLVAQNNQSTLGGVAYWDNISLKEIAGNHASQSTSASRPVLSARVNLLTYTEQFDNVTSWARIGSNPITANQTTAPNGTNTADLFTAQANGPFTNYIYQQGIVLGATSYKVSIRAKKGTQKYILIDLYSPSVDYGAVFDLDAGTYVGSAGLTAYDSTPTITPIGNGWYEIVATKTVAANTYNLAVSTATGNNATQATGDTIYIWGADLRVTNDGVGIPAYQRVAAATDYDTSGFPLYLKFDGTDDSLATASVDFSATDKISSFTGVRKLITTVGCLFESSVDSGANNGAFSMFASSGFVNDYYIVSRGTSSAAPTTGANTFNAPITNVVTGLYEISTDVAIIRVNGTQAISSATDQGTGNFGNYPLYIGRRGGSSLPYNGRLYSLIVRGAQSTDAQIASTEAWVNNVTKGY